MNLYKISQHVNKGYDTYDSAVVCAETAIDAQNMDPGTGKEITNWEHQYQNWAPYSDQVIVTFLGIADEEIPKGIVVSSYNAG